MNVSNLDPAKKVRKPISLNWRDLSLRNKIILAILLIEMVSIGVLAYFALTRAGQIVTSVSSKFENGVQAQTEAQLTDIVKTEAADADQLFSSTKDSLVKLADYRAQLDSQNTILGQGAYWDASTKLSLLPEGQHGNSATDVAAVFLPKTMTVDDKALAELNTSAYLDFIAPGVLKSQPQLVAIYYISALGSTTYYPNIGLASVVPADFDILSQPFFTVADPQNNPERIPRWTDPYQAPAGTGLIVTASTPVYSKGGFFKGVIGIDMQLARISENISQIKIGETGFAFLVDKTGRILAMPPEGYTLLGLQPEEVPVNESPKETILGKGSKDLQAVMNRLVSGESGLSTVVINNVETYIVFAPLDTPGYSLAVMVPTSELNGAIVTSRQETQSATTSAFQVAAFILIGLLVGAILLSLGVSQIITAPLTRLTQTAEQITSGDFSARAAIETQDETGILATAFNRMADQLREFIATLEGRVADRTKALATSTEVSRRLSAIFNRKELVAEVVNQVKNSFGYYHAQIYFYDKAKENLVMAGGTGKAGEMMLAQFHKVAKGRGLVGRAAETNEPVLVSNTTLDAEWLPNALLPETRSEVAIPISIGDKVLGVLDVQHNITDGLQREDVDSLQSIANQIAIALQNIQSTEIVTKRAAELQTVAAISTTAATISDIQKMLESVVHLTQRGFGLYHAHVFIYNENMERLEIVACGYKEGDEHEGTHGTATIPLEQEQSLVARAARTRQAVIVNDVRSDPGWLPNPLLPDTASELAVPMIVGDQLLGVLDVQSDHVNAFTDEDASIQTTLASQVATAVQNARSFSQSQRQAERETAVNLITQKIQNAPTVEAALQIAARELGHALGMRQTQVSLDPEALAGEHQGN